MAAAGSAELGGTGRSWNAYEKSRDLTATGVEPNRICAPFWRISEMPSVTISWLKWDSSSEPTVGSPDSREIRNQCSHVRNESEIPGARKLLSPGLTWSRTGSWPW